jgi:putative ABC transport system permease protein
MNAPMVAVINQAAARMLYPGEDPIGKEIVVDWDGAPHARIVGVAADSRFEGMETQPGPMIYLPQSQRPSLFCGFVIRAAQDPATVIAAVREAMREVDPDQGVFETSTMDALVANSVARPRLETLVLGGFGLIALTLACIGIYGMLAYSVSQRLREMGVRIALGATRGAILSEVLRGGMRLTVIGIAIGFCAALALTRYLESLLYTIHPTDPPVFALASTMLVTVAMLACYAPARRAARVDPMTILREE